MRRIKWGPQKCLRTFGERTSKEAEGVFPGRGKQTGWTGGELPRKGQERRLWRLARTWEKLIDWGFRALIVLNALLLLGTVGSMELGRLGISQGTVLCVGYMVVIAACLRWGKMR
jgi:hypothetical protein